MLLQSVEKHRDDQGGDNADDHYDNQELDEGVSALTLAKHVHFFLSGSVERHGFSLCAAFGPTPIRFSTVDWPMSAEV